MIQFQPVRNVLTDYVEVDTKHRLLAVKPARLKVLVESMLPLARSADLVRELRKG